MSENTIELKWVDKMGKTHTTRAVVDPWGEVLRKLAEGEEK